MIWPITGVALYLFCSLYAWGTTMADLNWHNRYVWAILNRSVRDNMGLTVLLALLGPFGAIVSALHSNFNQHGWQLWGSEPNDPPCD